MCRYTLDAREGASNHTDLWWNPAENGWGLGLAEQGEAIFLAWYSYAGDGEPQWLTGLLARQADGSFQGALNRALEGTPYTLLPDGALIIDGRVDEMINLGGTKVAPGEVERVLLQDPDVREAAAYGLETASGQTVLLAAVVLKGAFDEKSLLARCRTQLGQRAPMRLVQVDALPRNDAGKVMRRELAARTRVG